VVVRDEQKRLAALLEVQRRLHHPEVISEMQLARRLYARENSHDFASCPVKRGGNLAQPPAALKQKPPPRPCARCVTINDTETDGRVEREKRVLRQNHDTERMEP
jgi:hypothetical protein